MDFGIKNKHAFVAAASRGLGYSAAHELALEGADVTICGRNWETIRASAERISQQTGAQVAAVQADVSDAGSIEKALTTARQKFGAIEILITNAGGPPAGFFENMSEE